MTRPRPERVWWQKQSAGCTTIHKSRCWYTYKHLRRAEPTVQRLEHRVLGQWPRKMDQVAAAVCSRGRPVAAAAAAGGVRGGGGGGHGCRCRSVRRRPVAVRLSLMLRRRRRRATHARLAGELRSTVLRFFFALERLICTDKRKSRALLPQCVKAEIAFELSRLSRQRENFYHLDNR